MLELTRRKDEAVRIGSEISFTILRVLGDKVTIGFCAPEDVAVDRLEVYEAKRKQAQEATQPPD